MTFAGATLLNTKLELFAVPGRDVAQSLEPLTIRRLLTLAGKVLFAPRRPTCRPVVDVLAPGAQSP
ncbi:MAG: hypothetical protein ACK595_02610 [Planctomycetota bacterium]